MNNDASLSTGFRPPSLPPYMPLKTFLVERKVPIVGISCITGTSIAFALHLPEFALLLASSSARFLTTNVLPCALYTVQHVYDVLVWPVMSVITLIEARFCHLRWKKKAEEAILRINRVLFQLYVMITDKFIDCESCAHMDKCAHGSYENLEKINKLALAKMGSDLFELQAHAEKFFRRRKKTAVTQVHRSDYIELYRFPEAEAFAEPEEVDQEKAA